MVYTVHLVQMIAQVFHTTLSVCVAVYYWFYSYVHTYLQTVSNHVCKPFLGGPQSVTTPTATTNITTAITSSSCIAPLCSPSSNIIFSPVAISDSKPSSQHHLAQFNFKNSDSSLSNLQLIHSCLPVPSHLPLSFLFLLIPWHSQVKLLTSMLLLQPPQWR